MPGQIADRKSFQAMGCGQPGGRVKEPDRSNRKGRDGPSRPAPPWNRAAYWSTEAPAMPAAMVVPAEL